MKLLMPKCEEESYVKIQLAVKHLWGVNILTNKEKGSYGSSYRVKTDYFFCTLMRDTDVPHFTEISR